MRYVQINAFSNSWADQVIFKKHRELQAQGIDSYVFWGRGKPTQGDHEICLTPLWKSHIDAAQTRLDGRAGFHSVEATKRLLGLLDDIQPDVVHLHSLLGYYVNVEMLFDWLLRQRCKVLWTLHDCWAFTGHCMYFTYAGCDRWKNGGCTGKACKQLDTYPRTFCRQSVDWNFEQKKRIFTQLPADRLTLLAPSQWMADMTRESFLAKYPVEVVHNTVDTRVFRPTVSDFRQTSGVGNRFMILGVASLWSPRKGYEDLLRLANDLDDRFAIVIVGLLSKQLEELPKNTPAKLVGVGRTDSREQMVGIYSTADVFFNPTKEDNYPTVNLEAEACGTPVVTYAVGGAAEAIHRRDSSAVYGYDEGIDVIKRMAAVW
ncbi:MAG: glycosyltransferase [Olegusella sp.]|nr:glycosyltransferase [Olegusella sp.]